MGAEVDSIPPHDSEVGPNAHGQAAAARESQLLMYAKEGSQQEAGPAGRVSVEHAAREVDVQESDPSVALADDSGGGAAALTSSS